MSYDKLYDQLLARKETRESSTLSLVTLASSASLILFIFFLNDEGEHRVLINILGILFPLIAIIYREINFYYIQAHDNTVLNAILLKEFDGTDEQKKEIKNVIQYKKYRRLKKFLLRFLAVLPVLGWILVIDYTTGAIISFIIIMIIIAFSLDNKFKEPEDSVPSFLK